MSLAPTDPAVGIARLDDDRLELGERAIRKDVGPNQGKPYRPQREFLQLHLFFRTCVVGSGDPLVALDLAPMHDAPRFRVERVAPMQYREIVPHQEIAELPFMAHDKARLRGMGP